MRYVILIIDGESLAGESGDVVAGLGRAETPNLDLLCESGRVGSLATTPGHASSLGVGMLTLLGYCAPSITGVSSAVFDAAARGVEVGPGDWVMRAGLVGISPDDDEGMMIGDVGASREEADALFDDLIAHWRECFPSHLERVRFIGEGAERLLIDSDGLSYANVEMTSPRWAAGEPWIEHLPDGGEPQAADRLCTLISASRHFLAEHPVSVARAEQGLKPANLAWTWDAGVAGLPLLIEHLPHPAQLFAENTEALGVGRLIGLEAEGPGSLAERVAASGAEVVCAVVGGEAGRIDAEIVGPLVAALGDPGESPWRLLVSVSHEPNPGTAGGPVPFVLAGAWVRSVVPRRLCDGLSSDLRVDPGCELLEFVLRSGMRGRV